MIERAVRRRRPRLDITEGRKSFCTSQIRCGAIDDERHRGRDPRAGSGQAAAGIAVEQEKQRHRRRQDDHEIFRPPGQAERDPEHDPMAQLSVPQPGVEREAGERPERQLDHVVIELGGAEIEIVHAVDDQDRGQRAGCADQRPRRQPHRHESDDHHDLAERIDGGVGAEHAPGDLDATTAAAAACRSRAAIRGRKPAPRSRRAAG